MASGARLVESDRFTAERMRSIVGEMGRTVSACSVQHEPPMKNYLAQKFTRCSRDEH
jgi:hypothetical protein